MSNTYNLKFNLCYLNCTTFKEKELIILRNLLSGARLGRKICFSNYANVVFDEENDYKHETPIVTDLESFTRGKTNAIVYNITDDTYTEKYNKILIYKSVYKSEGYYGYVLFNTENDNMSHLYGIDLANDTLCIHIDKSLDIITREDMYKYYRTRYDNIKKSK